MEINNWELICALGEIECRISKATMAGNKEKVKGLLEAYEIMADRLVERKPLDVPESPAE